MALYLNGTDGNGNVVLGGIWNTGGSDPAWGSPFANAPGLTIAGILKPDDPFAGGACLIHEAVGTGSQDMWRLTRVSGGGLQLQVYGRDGGGNVIDRVATTTSTSVLTVGTWNRVMVIWDGATDTFAFWNNQQLFASSKSGTAVSALPPDTGAPLEIGAESDSDGTCTAGAYAEFGLWPQRLPDSDAIDHGRGIPIGQLSIAPSRFVKLDKVTQVTGAGFFGPGYSQHGSVVDEVTGTVYGQATRLYGSPPFSAPYQGAFGEWYLVPHPPLLAGPKPDVDLLPERRFRLPVLMGHPGKRSGNVYSVATDADLRQRIVTAVPGDDIIVTAPIKLTQPITFPDARAWTIDASTPRQTPDAMTSAPRAMPTRSAMAARTAMTARRCAGDIAYVRIMSPTLANLPTITTRRVPLPDGTTSVTLHESAKVWSGDYANMAVIQAGDDPFQAAIMDCGAQVTDRQASHMYWHGIHFKCSDYQVSDLSLLMWLVGQNQHPVGTVGGQYWHTDAKNSCLATHFVFNQCAFENDPQNTGANTGQLMQADMLWLAIVNCYADKWWSIGGGDGKLIAMGKTGGPFHFENNDWRSWTALWFTGGGGSEYTDATPSDMIIRRNWLHAPMAWTPAEVNAKRGSWTVNISASGSVTLASGTAWDNISYNPKPGCIMYDPLTGRARQIASASTTELFGNPSALQLASAWPGQPVSNLAVRFQITSTEWEVTPTLYNSGMDTPMPTATTTAGSRHVTFSEAVPQAVADRINAGDVLHLYLNNTEWYGDYYANAPSANAWTPPANHNGWGYMVGITRAQCKRKRIVSIASDRLSVETDPTQNAFAATETFPYSIVTSDGLFRHVLYHNKGSWENKTGRKWLQEGNVFEANGCRMYAVEQGYAEPPLGNVTISTDARGVCIATLLAGTAWGPYTSTWTGVTWPASTTPAAWPFGNPLRYYMGAPWQHIYLLGSTPFESEYPGFARLVHHVIDATHCELWPADPRYFPNGTRGTMGDGTYFVSWRPSTSPWMEVSHQCIRYNIWARGYPPVVYAEAPYGGHIVPGGHVTMHDNLFLRFGDRSILFDDGTNNLAALLPQDREGLFPGGSIGSGPPYVMAPGGQAVYEEPPVTGANGLYRCDHNTIARPHIAPHGATVFINTGGGITPPAKRTSFSDNLAVGLDGPVVPTGPSGITREVADTRPYLDALTTTMVGNVLVGAGTIVPATARWLHGPRNAAVTSADAVGMPNYANGATDGFALANYALAPIYTTGTISISGDGLIVTHDSGDFPTTVQTSQYIKTATHPALAKIQMASGKLGNTWNTYLGAHLFGKRNGLASPQGGGAPLAFQTNTTALPDSQWVQATNVSGSRAFGLAIRAGAPQTINGYVLVFQADAYYGEPYSNAYLVRLDNGAIGFSTLYQPGGWVELLQLAANDVWMFEAKGTQLGVSRNGTQIILYDTASNPIRYSSGLAGLASMANDPTLTVSTWSAGDYTGGGGGRVTRASDSFAGGGNQLLLETPLPERNVSAKAFAITFEGTASDGTNPGADLTTLALMTAGVRDPSRVH